MSESLYLEESLEAIVKTTVEAVGATGAALVLQDGTIAWPEGRAGEHAVRLPLRWKGRRVGELVCDRDTPFTSEERRLLASIAHHAAVALEHGRAVLRGVLAQEIHHRVKNNLQTVASLLRLQAANAEEIDPRKALGDSVNRILAIAAVHEVLTEQRDDDVDLGELVERLRAMLVQGLGAGKQVSSSVEQVSLHGGRATALALVFCELFGNALEHGGDGCGSSSAAPTAVCSSRSPTTGRGTLPPGKEPASRSCAPSSRKSSTASCRWSPTTACARRSPSLPRERSARPRPSSELRARVWETHLPVPWLEPSAPGRAGGAPIRAGCAPSGPARSIVRGRSR